MSTRTVYLTAEGRQKLEEELEYLRTVRRAEIAQRIREAKAEGDVTDNAGYEGAKHEQAFVEGRILTLEAMLDNAVLIDESTSSDTVGLGSQVTVTESGAKPETYLIVGSAEADPAQGRISNESPLGQALMDHRAGDEVAVNTPDGVLHFQIISIE